MLKRMFVVAGVAVLACGGDKAASSPADPDQSELNATPNAGGSGTRTDEGPADEAGSTTPDDANPEDDSTGEVPEGAAGSNAETNNGAGGAGSMGGTGANGGSNEAGGTGGGDGEPAQCLPAGGPNCSESSPCCEGTMCITDGVSVACAALCTDGSQCVSGCCAPVDESNSVCAPTEFCPAPAQTCVLDAECSTGCCAAVDAQTSICVEAALCAPAPAVICLDLVLLADDGTFLGEATSNAFATDSVCNEFGQYGSQFSSTSIFNQFGQYGSPFASLSAYNEFTTTPPLLYCVNTDAVLNPVSKNTFIAGAIDPDVLCAVLAANGL